MNEDSFQKFEKIVAEENPDLLQWLVYRTAEVHTRTQHEFHTDTHARMHTHVRTLQVPPEKGLDSTIIESLLHYTHNEKKLWVKSVESGNQ